MQVETVTFFLVLTSLYKYVKDFEAHFFILWSKILEHILALRLFKNIVWSLQL